MILPLQPEWNLPDTFWKWGILVIMPWIIAAGVMEKSAPGLVLPDEKSYRTPLSDALIESSEWRTQQQPELNWRQPRSPALDWRSEPSSQTQSTQSKKKINLFPRHQYGNPNDFDHINREEKPQIKVFEFGP